MSSSAAMKTASNDLRNRKGATSSSKIPSPRLFYEETPVPAAKLKWNAGENSSHDSNDSSDEGGSVPVSQIETTGTALSGDQVKKEESKLKKIVIRVVFGAGMFCVFAGSVSLVTKDASNVVVKHIICHHILTLNSLHCYTGLRWTCLGMLTRYADTNDAISRTGERSVFGLFSYH